MTILSVFAHTHVVLNLHVVIVFNEYKRDCLKIRYAAVFIWKKVLTVSFQPPKTPEKHDDL